MATYPLSFPAIGIQESRFGLSRVVSRTQSPFSLAQQVALLPGAAWGGEITLRPMTYAQAGAVKAFLADLNGEFGTFLYGDPDYLARGPVGTPTAVAASTNRTRNGQATGATNGVIGSGGALPTNWSITAAAGLTTEVLASGTDANGIGWVRVRISGTTSGTVYRFRTEGATQVTASLSQSWAGSCYVALTAGSLTNITAVQTRVEERDGAGSLLVNGSTNFSPVDANRRRAANVYTLVNASVARVTQAFALTFASGVAVDATFEIGGVQLEQQAAATPYIPTSSGEVSRPAGITVFGAGQTGNSLIVQGFERNLTSRLAAGDYIQLGTGAGAQLYQVTVNADSTELGRATLSIEPPLRSSPANGAVVTVTGARGVFRLNGQAMWDSDRSSVHTRSLSITEAISA